MHEKQFKDLKSKYNKIDKETQGKDLKILNLSRLLEQKDQEVTIYKLELQNVKNEIEVERQSHREELLNIEKDT